MESTLQDYLLGNASVAKWQAIMILSAAMAAVMMFNRVKKRDVSSERTPAKFSLKFFISDSLSRIMATLLSMFLVARISLVWIPPHYLVVFAIFIGMISDQLPVLFGWAKDEGIIELKKRVMRLMGKVEVVETKVDAINNKVEEIKNNTDPK